MQGWCSSMEDAIIFLSGFEPKHNTSLFTLCDGHGGSIVSKFVAENYPEMFFAYNNGIAATATKKASIL